MALTADDLARIGELIAASEQRLGKRLGAQLEGMEARLGKLVSENGQAIADLGKRVARLEEPDEPWKGRQP